MTGSGNAYCGALLASLLVMWPLLAVMFFLKRGFNPYDELSEKEMSEKGGQFAAVFSGGRFFCHTFILILSIYLIALCSVLTYARTSQSNGDKAWLAQKVSSMPFGALFFQPGMYFDCGLCLRVFHPEEEVIELGCDESHVLHLKCLSKVLLTTTITDCNQCRQKL